MNRIILGRTGLTVSVLGLGAGGDSRLGSGSIAEADSIRLVHAAIERGVNFIDTAEAYGTEGIIGKALREVPRDRVVISTKKTTRLDAPLRAEDVVASLHASLERLGTDHVDVYHLHGVLPHHYADLRERIVPVLLRLREQGKIRFLGITEAFAADPSHATLEQALRDDLWDVVMVGFNLLNQSARTKVFPLTRAKNVGTLIMFAVRRALSRPERLKELLADLAARGKVSSELGAGGLDGLLAGEDITSLPDAAYRFCRDEPGAHVILSGTSSVAHLLENARSLEAPPLSEAVRARLVEAFARVDDVSGH
ncbi:aldo/keto reductase [Sorangium cellulosum]|uniref:Aldo/keto reductase n=1 Tax=Sorangium cellulosum TaxID=56 RepID=A0A2L0EYY3_SORCE|nr:aldo/keto reductase [Sorangium cellulosum]AUX44475.1 aldo/keto reductase [Sorangium cellulosum]